jgi:hypothetical protein
MPRRLTILPLALLLLSCDDTTLAEFANVFDACEPLVLVPAEDTTARELAVIEEAIAMWNERAATRLGIEPVEGAATLPIFFREGPRAIYGYYHDRIPSIEINRRLDDEREQVIVTAHEIGHAFGLFHTAEYESVMNKGNRRNGLTDEDVAAVQALWGACEPSTEGWISSSGVR